MKIFILLAHSDWFADLTKEQQQEYINEHPNSKYAKGTQSDNEKTLSDADDLKSAQDKRIRPALTTKFVDGKRMAANGKPLPEHIQKLSLPPAWTDVLYNPDPDGALLARGKDSKGRVQSVYSEKFANQQAEAKFSRVKELSKEFPSIQAQNGKNRKSSNSSTKDAADCLHLIMTMGIRPGSKNNTKAEKQAYGATTLKAEHVIDGKPMKLKFVGKDGVDLELPVISPELAKMLRERASQAVSNKDGNTSLFPNTSDTAVLKYTHTLDGGHFKTKDFRTHLGCSVAQEAIKNMDPPKDAKEYKAHVRKIAVLVSSKLGNTPTIALSSYIAPELFASWRMSITK